MNPGRVLVKSLQVLSGKTQGTKRRNNQSEGKEEASPGGEKKRKQKKKQKRVLPQKHTATIGKRILELAPVATPCAAGDQMYEAAILSRNGVS